jgi:hypothetical protein
VTVANESTTSNRNCRAGQAKRGRC